MSRDSPHYSHITQRSVGGPLHGLGTADVGPAGGVAMQHTRTLLDWIGALTVTQGRLAGQPFVVLPWQRRFLRGAFADGVSSAAVSMGRGNGKSAFTAAIVTAAVAGPLARARADVVCVASSFTQARIIYEHTLAFLQPWIETEPSRWRIQDSVNRAVIEDRTTGTRVRCIGSDPRRAHGLAPLPAGDHGARSDRVGTVVGHSRGH